MDYTNPARNPFTTITRNCGNSPNSIFGLTPFFMRAGLMSGIAENVSKTLFGEIF